MAEQPADAVERAVFVPAPVQGLLLHPAADLVDDLGAEPDDVERVEHGDRVWELVADGVGVAAERVQGGVLDAGDELGQLAFQPVGVGGSGSAGNDVDQPCV
ncbi:MAG: hypothetical protein J2P17_04890 [Mycobacterium sp.]|nr:hypothetical protein [Mycobacterium sp.]